MLKSPVITSEEDYYSWLKWLDDSGVRVYAAAPAKYPCIVIANDEEGGGYRSWFVNEICIVYPEDFDGADAETG